MIEPPDVTRGWVSLGRQLAGLRRAAAYTQQNFAPLTCYGRSTIANVETGRQRAPREFWVACDQLLDAQGALLRGYDAIQVLARDQRRRQAEAVTVLPRGDVAGDVDNNECAQGAYEPGSIGSAGSDSRQADPVGLEVGDMRRRQVIDAAALVLSGGVASAATDRLGDLVDALTEPPGNARDEQTATVSNLRSSVITAKRNYQGCRYSLVLRELPHLLRLLHAARTSAPPDQAPAIDVLLADAYQVAGSVALKFEDKGLAAIAADRSMTAACRSGDQVAVVASSRLVTHTLASGGHYARAASLAENTGNGLRPSGKRFTPAAASVYGALLHLDFIDQEALEAQTGAPVRSAYRSPDEPRQSAPPADAVIVAPATFNTINKLAAGISDNYALGVLAECVGMEIPIVILPFINAALAARTPLKAAIEALRYEGVRVLLGDGEFEPHPVGTGGRHVPSFPWATAVTGLPTTPA